MPVLKYTKVTRQEFGRAMMNMHVKSSLVMLALAYSLPAFSANPEWENATALYSSGNYSAALSALRKLAEVSPRDASIHYMIGRCYKELNKPTQAKAEFEWVSKYAPDAQTKAMAAAMLNQGVSGVSPATSAIASSGPGEAAPTGFVNDSVEQTISAAYRKGWSPCPGSCLNLRTPGWHHQQVEGHPDTDMWMTYSQGRSYNQFHIGHIIKEAADGSMPVDTGACPRCNGTGWVRAK
jgi:tetratricopeptide (TPR) repeat protein